MHSRVIEVLERLSQAHGANEEKEEAAEETKEVGRRDPQHPLEEEQVELGQHELHTQNMHD